MTPRWARLMKTVSIVLVASLVSTAVVVAGVRLAQRHWFPQYRQVAIRISLPGQRVSAISFGGHVTTAPGSTSPVTARLGATGLAVVWGQSKMPVGYDIVPADNDLRNLPQTVDYTSTAAALVELSAFPTPSPLLSAVVQMAALSSPTLPALASVLRSEAATRADFLATLDTPERVALSATDSDVKNRVVTLFTNAPPQRLTDSVSAGASPPLVSNADSTAAPPLLVAQDALNLAVPLPDQNGRSACQSHAIADALCLMDRIPPGNEYLQMNDWTQSWQLVYQSSDLATPGGAAVPFALLPPAVNAPITLSGALATTVQTIATPVLDRNMCEQASSMSTANNWIEPTACGNVGASLLSQLTLTSQSSLVQDYVPSGSPLLKAPLTVVGTLTPTTQLPITQTGFEEALAGEICLGLTMVSQVVLPVVQLILDEVIKTRGGAEDGETKDLDSEHKAAELEHVEPTPVQSPPPSKATGTPESIAAAEEASQDPE